MKSVPEILDALLAPVGIILLVIVATAILTLAGNAGDRHLVRESCAAFGRESGREVRYVDYTFWTRDCLCQAKDGKWISTSLLREVTK